MLIALLLVAARGLAPDPGHDRTIFQTSSAYSDRLNLRADDAVVYGFGNDLAGRVKSWRDRGYGIQFMTGVAWGEYQDYLYGRWDGTNHEDEVQTTRTGEKIGHGGDVYYMSPGESFGKYLCVGVQKALDQGVRTVFLEEPEFWARGGYGAGFKREWQSYYHEPWQAPDSSPDARWRASKLMYFLYRRALQQVFEYIEAYNAAHHTSVQCCVPTHSLLNYASWHIVSPESSLARLKGCDGYIAQVWTGTARQPNFYHGVRKERTFETAFLEYGAMQAIVRGSGRQVWYLADPVEDSPNHDWGDYRRNYEATLTASLLHPEVAQYEVMPWPERVFTGKYPSAADPKQKTLIPDEYGTELQVVMNALKEMNQPKVSWEGGTRGVGVVISDSLMFERDDPNPSDADLGNIYGLALPFLERGMPIEPVQLEDVTLPGYLKGMKVLLMTYEGMKPLSPDVHAALASWVRSGGRLFLVDDDQDPYNHVREWWNSAGLSYATPRLDLFARLGLKEKEGVQRVGQGAVDWIRANPAALAHQPFGDELLTNAVRDEGGIGYSERGALVLHRGPFTVACAPEAGVAATVTLQGRFLDLFDANLPVRDDPILTPGSHRLLIELGRTPRVPTLLASAGSMTRVVASKSEWTGVIEGIAGLPAIVAIRTARAPSTILLEGAPLETWTYSSESNVLWLKFPGTATPRRISVTLSPQPAKGSSRGDSGRSNRNPPSSA